MIAVELLDGHERDVLLPARVVGPFARILRREFETFHRAGVQIDREAWEALESMEKAATVNKQVKGTTTAGRFTETLTVTTGSLSTPGNMVEVTVSQAAELEGTSRQAIYARIKRGSLPSRLDGNGRQVVQIDNLQRSAR